MHIGASVTFERLVTKICSFPFTSYCTCWTARNDDLRSTSMDKLRASSYRRSVLFSIYMRLALLLRSFLCDAFVLNLFVLSGIKSEREMRLASKKRMLGYAGDARGVQAREE
eukprot:3956205-Pleurochrysis_carterae.AAC.4